MLTPHYFTAQRGGADLPLHYFTCGIIDPGWHWATRSDKGRGKSRQYTCSPIDELLALPVGELFAPVAAVALWNTQYANGRSWHARLLEGWGFEPQTTGAWLKLTANGKPFFGLGKILRSCVEFYTIGTRGHPSPQSRSVRNFITAPWRGESVKPDELYVDMEQLYGGPAVGPCVELFARQHYPGWHGWGNELIPNEEPSSLTPPGKPEPCSARSRLIIHVKL